ncbi:hypothetical protein A3K93_13695 (plasmid) [Acinetobacter sp. NCu2D-2]|uniref:hypothetical protein n=1 Tax=Acinetobacter sp. NCu2D-2 TaxID=1608473 RepID=UPI0007CDA0A5|nr:hypothetical protein [Acinetobacter sp. NCu2D-2]ANF83289.1 hypothetical protein A3K93_13695 [Acinetobacter sp. NCu2D-2]
MLNTTLDEERDIAKMAGHALSEKFIEGYLHKSIIYVKNDHLMLKTPNCEPVSIRALTSRNQETSKKFSQRGKVYKLKKRLSSECSDHTV